MSRNRLACILWQPGSGKWEGGRSFGLNRSIRISLEVSTAARGWLIYLDSCQARDHSEMSQGSDCDHLCHQHSIKIRLLPADLEPPKYRELNLRFVDHRSYLPDDLVNSVGHRSTKWLDIHLKLKPGHRLQLIGGEDKSCDWSLLSQVEFHCLIQGHAALSKLKEMEAALSSPQAEQSPR